MIIDELLSRIVKRYRSTVTAIGKSCAHAIPVIGQDLQQSLQIIQSKSMSDAASVDRVGMEVEAELVSWSHRAAQFYRTKTEEVKEIMIAVARVGTASVNVMSEMRSKLASSVNVCSLLHNSRT